MALYGTGSQHPKQKSWQTKKRKAVFIFFKLFPMQLLFLCGSFLQHVGREPEVSQTKLHPTITTRWWKTRQSADSAADLTAFTQKHTAQSDVFHGVTNCVALIAKGWKTQTWLRVSLRTSGSSILRCCKHTCYVRRKGSDYAWVCALKYILRWIFVWSKSSWIYPPARSWKSNSAGKGRHAAKFTQSAKGSWEISGRTGMDRWWEK